MVLSEKPRLNRVVQCRFTEAPFPLKLSLSLGGEDEVLFLPAFAGTAADDLVPIPPQPLPFNEEGWFGSV